MLQPEHFIRRDIPWPNVVAFHREIARRAEETFFALPLGRTPSDRWSSIANLEIQDFSGEWRTTGPSLQSESFRNSVLGNRVGEAFMGGPCWVQSKKEGTGWRQEWCPFLYRAVRFDMAQEGFLQIIPDQGGWEISPIVMNVLDRKGFCPRLPISELLPEVLESSQVTSQETGRSLTDCLIEKIGQEFPDFVELFSKAVRRENLPYAPSRWVIFSPPDTGPLTQNLVRDYDKLSEILEAGQLGTGGLRLFEGSPDVDQPEALEPAPIVPLNDSQRSAVKGILASKPVTVISGPPGCGKSQVVLSLMLNAWQQNVSVLFASNNNQAVDVVRERLQRFEGHFPIAIRAGSKKRSTVTQALADTLNYITGKREQAAGQRENVASKQDSLVAQRNELKQFLSSQLPQQVDEAVRSSLGAYGNYKDTAAEITSKKNGLLQEHLAFNISSKPEMFLKEVVEPLNAWLTRISEFNTIINQEITQRRRLEGELLSALNSRNSALQRAGLAITSLDMLEWLVFGPGPALLRSWLDRLRAVMARPLEQELASYDWNEGYDRWRSDIEATNWAVAAKDLSVRIRHDFGTMKDALDKIQILREKYLKQESEIKNYGIPSGIKIDSNILSGWAEAYAYEKSLPLSRTDWLPWSQRNRTVRNMKRQEKALQSTYPISIWRRIGKLDGAGRDKLADVVEQTQLWLSIRDEWNAMKKVRDEVEDKLASLRGLCSELDVNEKAPESYNLEEWLNLSRRLLGHVEYAEDAAAAWTRRTITENAAAELRTLTFDFTSIAPGVPIRDAWVNGAGSSFCRIITKLGAAPSSQTVVEARSLFYTGALEILINSWEEARDAENLSRQYRNDIDRIPSQRDRYEEWMRGIPSILSGTIELPAGQLPESSHDIYKLADKYRDWAARWRNYNEKLLPELENRKREEYRWAAEKLKTAVELLPDDEHKGSIVTVIEDLWTSVIDDWPTSDIQQRFENYIPERIKARLQGLDAEIEQLSFERAKEDWLRRLVKDREVQKSLDDLHTHYKRNSERIEESAFPLFKKALEAVPIWITTAQSPQSIPMLPDLFDILVIDEATQCTVTNVLPLVYRAKRIAVIGDTEQLPAIPNIGTAAEFALASKFHIDEGLLNVIGHAENDLYRASIRCLPGGRHDVIALAEHYRSHPLIIGFSNRHVYQTALKLRTDPANVSQLPLGSAIHGENVNGQCTRGQYGSSWKNSLEAQAVCDLIGRLRQEPGIQQCSLGIVTPFRAQMDEISEKLRTIDLLERVTVGTAHTYQGDERDIMIFSPVVARGITDGAARWVENPRNLINVAITRARRALFVVADFAACRMQTGILGDLINYVTTVETLRNTSTEELELFSWMVVQGWDPLVHHVVRDIEVDFVLSHEGRRLAIEVDGSQHANTTEQDRARDAFLRGMGYDVLRIPARAVRETPSLVIRNIGERIGLPV